MLPKYVLAEPTAGQLILGICEWEDLLPAADRRLAVKPLYSSSMRDYSTAPTRTIAGMSLFELKQLHVSGATCLRTEREIASQLAHLVGDNSMDEITALVRISAEQVRRTWDAKPVLDTGIAPDVLSGLRTLLAKAVSPKRGDPLASARLIGSWLYQQECLPETDVDIAIECDAGECKRLRSVLSTSRLTDAKSRPEHSYFDFPFRIQMGAVTIDLLPSLPSDAWHPLKDALAWQRVGGAHWRRCVIANTGMGAYAWPTYEVTDEPQYITLFSNGFRGSLAAGDDIEVMVETFNLSRRQHQDLLVDFILDPWTDIKGADRLFDFRRDVCFR